MFFSSQQIKDRALALGFAACGIARAEPVAGEEADRLDRWLAGGCHAGMRYMENHRAIRLDPAGLVEGARSVISVALNYYPMERREPSKPYIAYYAYGKDYHDVVKRRLRQLWQAILDDCRAAVGEEEPPAARVFTDSAPILERYWAWKAGLGWIGKNTCLILPGKGSFFFLGEIVTTLEVDLFLPGRDCHHLGGGPLRHAAAGPLRLVRAVPEGVPDRGAGRPPPSGRLALPLVPHHRAPGRDPRGAGGTLGQPAVWLRHVPEGLPVESLRHAHGGGGVPSLFGVPCFGLGYASRLGRGDLPPCVRPLGGEARQVRGVDADDTTFGFS